MSTAAEPQGAKPVPHTRRFRRAAGAVLLTPDQRRRQEQVMRRALDLLGSRERIMAFLNDPCDALGGRPIDVAIDSDDGLARTLALLDPGSTATRHP